MYHKVRVSRNRSICRMAAAIVSKWPQDERTCGITKNMQYVHTYGTQKRPMRFVFISNIQKNSRCCITHLKCSIWYYIPQRIFMSIWNEVTSRYPEKASRLHVRYIFFFWYYLFHLWVISRASGSERLVTSHVL